MAMDKVQSPTVFLSSAFASPEKGKTERRSEEEVESEDDDLDPFTLLPEILLSGHTLYTCVSSALGEGIKASGTNGPAATPLERP